MSIVLFDVSHWEPELDYDVIAAGGVSGLISKASQGNYSRDSMFAKNAQGAASNGMIAGAYHWLDPRILAETQINYFLDTINPYLPQLSFLAVDYEQWWNDWNAWSRWVRKEIPKSEVPVIPGNRLSDHAQNAMEFLVSQSDLPVLIYGRKTFLDEFTPQSRAWINKYLQWIARWPWGAGEEDVTYLQLKEIAQSLEDGDWPVPMAEGGENPVIWQFSGDRFGLPGIWTNSYRTRRARVDVNIAQPEFWNDLGQEPPTKVSLLDWAKAITGWAKYLGYTGPEWKGE